MNKWIAAALAIVAALAVGIVLARIVRAALARPGRPEALRASAAAIASLVFSTALVVGLITALGFVNRQSLDTLPESLVRYVPKALSAAIVLIVANVGAGLVASALDRSLGHVSPTLRRRVPTLVKAAVMGAATLIAANQLGVDTTILTLAAAALFFSVGLAAALMVGLGSRRVSDEIAAGRALRTLLDAGDHLTLDTLAGTVVKVHSVAVELAVDGAGSVLVPNSAVLGQSLRVVRAGRATAPTERGQAAGWTAPTAPGDGA